MYDAPIAERTFPRLIEQQAARSGGRTVLLFEDRRYTYADLERITRIMANRFRALGVAKGTHVATLMNNCPELLFTYFALCRLGAVTVPVNTASRGDILIYYLVQSRSTMLVAEHGLVDRFLDVQDRCTDIARLVVFDEAGDGAPVEGRARMPVVDFRSLETGDDTAFDSPARFNELSHISYTSGTTGPSKGNMATHAHTINLSIVQIDAYGYTDVDVLYTCLPLSHGNALVCCALPALIAGARVAVSRRFSASSFWQDVHRFGVTQFNLLGAMVNIIWSQPPGPLDRGHKVRQAMVVPVPADIHDAFEERYGLTITSLYALTDFGMATIRGPGVPADRKASSGRAVPGVQVRVVDDDDFELPAGEVGEVVLRADDPWTAPLGYYRMPEATWGAWRNLWFHTGDRGWFDADGWFYFVDRKKDAIRRRGQNISSWEIEQALLRHPAIADCAAYAVKSEMSEDEVMVSVELRPGAALDEAALIAFSAEAMPYYMVPRYVEFRQSLPRTESEKVQKYKLRAEAEARMADLWDREKAGIKVTR